MKPLQITFAPLEDEHAHNGVRSTSHSNHPSPALKRTHTTLSLGIGREGATKHVKMSDDRPTERTRLLSDSYDAGNGTYTDTAPQSPMSRRLSRVSSYANSIRTHRSHRYERGKSANRREPQSPVFTRSGLRTPKLSRSGILDNSSPSERVWYDQFTSIDWVHDNVADGQRALALRKRKDLRGRLWTLFDSAQGWILVALIGCLTAAAAYVIDIAEAALFDLKRGYCSKGFHLSRARCCAGETNCQSWRTWSEILHPSRPDSVIGDYVVFVIGCIFFASIACFLTLLSKKEVPLNIASTLDENLGADRKQDTVDAYEAEFSPEQHPVNTPTMMTYYSAAGSGVAEVKVILSGFVLHGYLGFKTLLLKCPALVFSVASGMSLGKEGPFVHIATCIGNVACRMFSKYNLNDGKRREVLSAAAASGVAVAFGSPLGGVLFSLEEVSYYFPSKTLFRTFFCCIVAALSLKFLNPYGTNKIVIFEVRYVTGWHVYELVSFAILGVAGGLAGAGFIKASRFWATTFRRWQPIKRYPWFEVLLVACITGLVTFWNRYANLAVTELLLELAQPCAPESDTGLCPRTKEDIPSIVGYLLVAFVIKAFLTIITFGIKVPAGIYVPSMVCGGLMGRTFGHLVQYMVLSASESSVFSYCSASKNVEQCITPGVYALVAAGATMCGVTRLSVTLAVILFELTGSLDHVLPFAIGVLTAKWTADFVEPASIYDLLINMNSYPFLENKHTPLFEIDSQLRDITPRFRGETVIDISISPYVKASELRAKLSILQSKGELDGGLPIIREKTLVGLIPAPDLEFGLDRIESPEDETLCLMSHTDRPSHALIHANWFGIHNDHDDEQSVASSSASVTSTIQDNSSDVYEVDLVGFIDPAPVTLESCSPMNLVYQCFSKLGLRHICVVEAGEYRGMVHKKAFVKYLKSFEAKAE